MKRTKKRLIILSIGTAIASVVCAVYVQNAYIGIIGITVAAVYGAIGISLNVKSA